MLEAPATNEYGNLLELEQHQVMSTFRSSMPEAILLGLEALDPCRRNPPRSYGQYAARGWRISDANASGSPTRDGPRRRIR